MRFVVLSLAVHALLLWLFVRGHDESPHVVRAEPTITGADETPMVVEMLAPAAGGGGGGQRGDEGDHVPVNAKTPQSAATRAAHIGSTRARSVDPWAGLSVRTETNADGNGNGNGNGIGNGTGNGIGFGNGGGIPVEHDVPPPPPPPAPPPSKARKATLIWPTRDLDVEDESALFVAKVTVDTDGSVVGARMLTNRPGSRAEHAANAIWTFRYAPALDDSGAPIRSTFEQSFQVR